MLYPYTHHEVSVPHAKLPPTEKLVLVTTLLSGGYVLELLIIILGQQYISCVTCVLGDACPGTHCHGCRWMPYRFASTPTCI